ncbi:uncharacterized protein Dana_GF27193 [Drosophila ananassae]|uniref:Ubiquitin-like domain-containing protein n=1 Tax=Drosophila ananassae TaxID=7217 RepID=A0A0P8XIT7_DROAN|nr:uncharacterized protein Dana_GF27193 [Drosophila ananassae]
MLLVLITVARNGPVTIGTPAYWSRSLRLRSSDVNFWYGGRIMPRRGTPASLGMEDRDLILVQFRPAGRIARRRLSRRSAWDSDDNLSTDSGNSSMGTIDADAS